MLESNSKQDIAEEIENVPLLQDIAELNRFSGAPAEFLQQLLKLKAEIVKAPAAALLRPQGDVVAVLSYYPKEDVQATRPAWLKEALHHLSKQDSDHQIFRHFFREVSKDSGEKVQEFIVFLPVKVGSQKFGIQAFLLQVQDEQDLQRQIERLEILLPYFDFYEGRRQLIDFREKTERLYQASELLISLNTQEKFLGASMALCNELSARYSCSRVSIGFLKSRYVKLTAMSNTEKFKKKMALVQGLEKVMEESLDQDLEVIVPQQSSGDYVARAAANYAHEYGPLAILSLPIRHGGQVVAVLTLEREQERPFTRDEVQASRLVLDLFAARLMELKRKDRWFGKVCADLTRSFFAMLVGAKYTWMKIIFILVCVAAYFLATWTGVYQVEATFSFQAEQEQYVTVPFDGELAKVFVKNGDVVISSAKLAQLDTTKLYLELNNAQAKLQESLKRVSVAMKEAKTSEAQIARATIEQVRSDINLIEYDIAHAVIKAPIAGHVVAPDLHKKENSVVRLGEEFLSIANIESLEAILYVPESQIADTVLGQKGELAAAGYPDRRVPFTVTEIDKVAKVHAQKNVFRVRVNLEPVDTEAFKSWAKAGMEGMARIDVEERLYVWIWTREVQNWLRMKLWI